MTANPFEQFLQYGENVKEMHDVYGQLVQRNSPTPLYLALPKEEQQRAREIAASSEVTGYADVINFGMEAQQDVKKFANLLYAQMRKADSEKIDGILHALVKHLDEIDPEQLKPKKTNFLQKLFKKNNASSIAHTVSLYKKLSKQVDRLAIELAHAQKQLLIENDKLDKIYEKNKEHFMHINVFIAAIELKLQELREITLPQQKAAQVERNELFESQSLQSLEEAIEWLDRRKYELEISREITLQTAPQIRLVQRTNRMLIEKINSSVLATVPMWQTQIATILTIGHQARIDKTEARMQQVNEQMLKTNIRSVQNVNQATSVDQINALKKTQTTLVDNIKQTLDVSTEQSEFINETETTRSHRYNPDK